MGKKGDEREKESETERKIDRPAPHTRNHSQTGGSLHAVCSARASVSCFVETAAHERAGQANGKWRAFVGVAAASVTYSMCYVSDTGVTYRSYVSAASVTYSRCHVSAVSMKCSRCYVTAAGVTYRS